MIVDASVALKWLVVEPESGEALTLLGRSTFEAPALLHVEVGNAIWKKQRRGELGPDPGLATLPEQLASLVETIDETPMIGLALGIARSIDHPIYDCVYLAMAVALDSRLVTADHRFAAKFVDHPYADRIERFGS